MPWKREIIRNPKQNIDTTSPSNFVNTWQGTFHGDNDLSKVSLAQFKQITEWVRETGQRLTDGHGQNEVSQAVAAKLQQAEQLIKSGDTESARALVADAFIMDRTLDKWKPITEEEIRGYGSGVVDLLFERLQQTYNAQITSKSHGY